MTTSEETKYQTTQCTIASFTMSEFYALIQNKGYNACIIHYLRI